ncbi:hypothetical protein CVT24_002157 [Panaeolus cyanescens]|uniref:Uncharacterized protein n=1 Tax=Panaeolus cyanescens TaxID=181874 RepID=A0A409YHZ1_9AGAR|nr:hypothetical protein CVT24_002157 [Panaeolus cyanescens]
MFPWELSLAKKPEQVHWTNKRDLHDLRWASDHLYWSQRSHRRHHCLLEKNTHEPATLSIVVQEVQDNTWIACDPPRHTFNRPVKLWCIGGKPLFAGADWYWKECTQELDHLMDRFRNDSKFAYAVDGFSTQIESLLVKDVDGIKFQHPMTGTLYGVEDDDMYTAFVDRLPRAFKRNKRGSINPLPAYDLQGNVIRPSEYRSTLYDKPLEIVFTFHHFHFDHHQKASFIARPVEPRTPPPALIRPPPPPLSYPVPTLYPISPFTTPLKRSRSPKLETIDPKIEGHEEQPFKRQRLDHEFAESSSARFKSEAEEERRLKTPYEGSGRHNLGIYAVLRG